jgi:hypothetical protein
MKWPDINTRTNIPKDQDFVTKKATFGYDVPAAVVMTTSVFCHVRR